MKNYRTPLSLALSLAIGFSYTASAQNETLPSFERCLLTELQTSSGERTVDEIRKVCREREEAALLVEVPDSVVITNPEIDPENLGLVSSRIIRERLTEFDPYVITPHQINYLLPVLTTNQVNPDAYATIDEFAENFEQVESKFQISLKAPLNYDSLFIEGDALYFAFTIEAWWQVYSDNISKPFRETNYRPELFYLAPLPFHPFEGNTGFMLGIEHQSNGRSQLLSRSWNRVYANLIFEKDNYALFFKPWWRLPEDEDEFPGDPDGDDNPDIADFMGYFEFGGAYKWQDYELSVMARRNVNTSNGALELGLSFPLWGKLRGYVFAFDGYGESLIDYNHSQTRFGLGIALNDIL